MSLFICPDAKFCMIPCPHGRPHLPNKRCLPGKAACPQCIKLPLPYRVSYTPPVPKNH